MLQRLWAWFLPIAPIRLTLNMVYWWHGDPRDYGCVSLPWADWNERLFVRTPINPYGLYRLELQAR